MFIRRAVLLATLAAPLLAVSAPANSAAAAALQQTGSSAPAPAPAPADAFLDAGARDLFERARAARHEADRSIHSYEAVVRQRAGVSLRTPLKDRNLYREESASRVRWFRDAPAIVELLAGREQTPAGVEAPSSFSDLIGDDLFDPAGDRLYLGFAATRDSSWVVHPLASGAEARYRYRSGDTLSIAFPDGRRLRVAELQVLPRERSPRLITGALWVEPASGAIVQAVYRLARDFDLLRDGDAIDDDDVSGLPGFLKPIEFRLDMVVVEYSYWNMQHWLPRIMRVEGLVRAGAVRAPFGMEIAYDIEDVWSAGAARTAADSAAASSTADSVFAAWAARGEFRDSPRRNRGRNQYRELVPRDPAALVESAELPPPIWRDAPAFISTAEVRALERALERLPAPPRAGMRVERGWAIASPGLLRYNRVEGLSVGASAYARYEPYSVRGVARVGIAERVPGLELGALRDTRRFALQFNAFHALRTVEEGDRALGFGASLGALTLGRDDGDYFRATGVGLEIAPSEIRRQSWRAGIELARHAPVERNTHWSLPRMWDEARTFRETIHAEAGDALTGTLVFSPWWGADPMAPQGGAELMLQGATGDFDFARARLTLRGASPLPAGLRVGAEAAAGTSTGTPPIQRQWFVGGPATLRGYPGAAAIGPDFARTRLELARHTAAAGLAVFGDAGWAGTRSAATADDVLYSAGVGATLLDGLLRIDLARALRRPHGWRLEFYLDALL